ncbi:hypothetical protein PG993_013563 [Apiospora rasikravindrae]|uniref:Uncharacterized protein n=1 Tax=Apiospora rasikravindrae TaxID=990691 RepID=A0ABR1RXZ5_9PEZI
MPDRLATTKNNSPKYVTMDKKASSRCPMVAWRDTRRPVRTSSRFQNDGFPLCKNKTGGVSNPRNLGIILSGTIVLIRIHPRPRRIPRRHQLGPKCLQQLHEREVLKLRARPEEPVRAPRVDAAISEVAAQPEPDVVGRALGRGQSVSDDLPEAGLGAEELEFFVGRVFF